MPKSAYNCVCGICHKQKGGGTVPRPLKWRKICRMPSNSRYGPLDAPAGGEPVSMTVDEYETVRLIDLENLTQEECAARMNVARTTVQGIYDAARKKIALSIVNGAVLVIGGGEYRLCDGTGPGCGGNGCRRNGCVRQAIDEDGKQ